MEVVKSKYEKIGEFISEVMTEERVKIARESSIFCENADSTNPFALDEFRYIVEDLRRYNSSSYKRMGLKAPFTVVNYEANVETDHDHGAWTDAYVLNVKGRFYKFEFDFYGQGDFDDDETKWKDVKEVFPKEVTTIVYK